MSKVAIIGGGASGLTAAIYASLNNEVTIFERNKECGKKITITGNGRCNYWNEDQTMTHYHSTSNKLPMFFENNEDINNFFNLLNLYPYIENGYYYPYSKQAISVRNALVRVALARNVRIITEKCIETITPLETGFILNQNTDNYYFDKVILATGSKSAPKTGSDGIGYLLAKQLGHPIITPNPSLVQLISNEPFCKDWAGIRAEALVSLWINNQKIKEERGEIQLTKSGASGICVYNVSRYVKAAIKNSQTVSLHIRFLPDCQNVLSFFEQRTEELKNACLDVFLENFLPYKLAFVLIKQANLNKTKTWNSLTSKEKNNLIRTITAFSLPITDTFDFADSQCTNGGVDLTTINLTTMESKIVPGLYIIGELLDVDGDCGGYNLAFAWLSGIKAGKNC